MAKVFKKIKEYFSEWNWFELTFIIVFELAFIVLGIVLKQSFFSCLYSIAILLGAFFLAKGKWYAYIFCILGILNYVYLSFTEMYYAEAVWHLCFTVPMYVVSMIQWFKHQQGKEVKIRRITKLETILFILGVIVLCVLIWLILTLIEAPQALTSALAVTFSAMANYLAMRRSDWSFVAYCFDDVFVIVLWLIPVIQGETAVFNVMLTMFAFLINDTYGLINWSRIKRKQSMLDSEKAEVSKSQLEQQSETQQIKND